MRSVTYAVVVMLGCSAWTRVPAHEPGSEPERALTRCRAQTQAEARLSCYDAIPLASSAAQRWQGRNNTDTFAFVATANATLVMTHDDAIFVAALKDADGKLLENLHLAGPGSLKVPLRAAGEYQMSLSATGRWTAQLIEP